MARLDIEVVEHFHVIGDEADRSNDDCARKVLLFYFAKVVEDIGFEPGLSGRSAAALVDKCVVRDSDARRDQPTNLFQLRNIVRSVGHRHGNAVRDVNQLDVSSRIGGDLRPRLTQAIVR